MAIYTGIVTVKNGLGRSREVTVTDDEQLARAFGVEGAIGGSFAGGKVQMLQLEGKGGHAEVAVDPNDIQEVDELSYIKSHTSKVVRYQSLADTSVLRPELERELHRINPEASVQELSNNARSALVKLALGQAEESDVRGMVVLDDPEQGQHDLVARAAAPVEVIHKGRVAGVDYQLIGRGTSVVALEDENAVIRLKFEGEVDGSASSAGSKYKKTFKSIKDDVTNIKKLVEDPASEVQLVNEPDILSHDVTEQVTNDLKSALKKLADQIDEKYADLEDFNPASVKNRIWQQLGLAKSDVSDSGQSEDALRAFDAGEITALNYANDPENGLVEKLAKAVRKRLENADVNAIAEQMVDEVFPNILPETRTDYLAQATAFIERHVQELIADIEPHDFSEAYGLYTQPNIVIVNEIKELSLPDVQGLREEKVVAGDINYAKARGLYEDLLFQAVYDVFQDFNERYYVTDYLATTDDEVSESIASQIADNTWDDVKTELSDNIEDELETHIKENYNDGYFEMVIMRMVDKDDDFKTALLEEASAKLSFTPPYSRFNAAQWTTKLQGPIAQSKNTLQLGAWLALDEVDSFIEDVLPDYETA